MKLLTKELEKKLLANPIGSHESIGDAECIVKFFNPCGSGTWLICEADKWENGDIELYGIAEIFEAEFGSVMLSELQDYKGPLGIGIERDLYFQKNLTMRDAAEHERMDIFSFENHEEPSFDDEER